MDLERLPAAIPDARPGQVQDHFRGRAVSEGRLWFCGYGRHDGMPSYGHHPDHHLLPHLPEVHREGCYGWSR